MNEHMSWFEAFYQTKAYTLLKKRPIVYLCAEFAFFDKLPIFAGGLGVLAADFVLEASDRAIPLIAVGIYYKEGYVSQQVDAGGNTKETVKNTSTETVGLTPVTTDEGEKIRIDVPIQDRMVKLQAWKMQIGTVPVYLLDSDIEENSQDDRNITKRLYTGDKEVRLKQEIILGIGGLRLIEKLHIHPIMYHMNEGNSAFLGLELMRHEMHERNIDFFTAQKFAQRRIVFTNHTLVSAGNDLFNDDLIISMFQKYATEALHIPVQQIVRLGKLNENTMFSMTTFSFSMAGKINAVSQLHAQKAWKIWPNNPMHAITNGINIKRWDAISATQPMRQSHQANKKKLLEVIQKETGQVWHEDELLLGWARRMVEYKRPLSIIEDVQRLVSIAKSEGKTVHIVFAGAAHPSDTHGLELIKTLREKIHNELQGIVVYLPNYNLELAGLLTAGCDVWLNTPIVGFEACGTSGMKAALNGVLPVTTKDGWVDEIESFGIGWILDSDTITKNFLDTLENNVVPLYYGENNPDGSHYWELNMINARDLIVNHYSTTKMLREYIQRMYIPLIEDALFEDASA